MVRLPADGDYYVEVDDPYTPERFFASSFPLLFYHLRVRTLSDGVEGFALAHGSAPSTISFARDARTGYGYVTLVGELGEVASTFEIPGMAAQALIARVLPSGPEGNGSTAQGGELDFVDGEQHVLARIDLASGQSALDPPIDEASYSLRVQGAGELGDNPFYVLDLLMLEDNPREQSDAANGELAGAEAIELTGTVSRRGLLLTTLPENDVDYFMIETMGLESIAAVCEGESGGSGVRGLSLELRDDTDQVLATATEGATTNLELEPVMVDPPGKYYVRLSSTTPAADESSAQPWARCAVLSSP